MVNRKDGRRSLKLADFGLSMEVDGPMFLVCGTPTYVAPEILDERGLVLYQGRTGPAVHRARTGAPLPK